MLIIVRHARTAMNEDGHERLRGWLNIPLSKEGQKESEETAKMLKGFNLDKIDKFYSSPLRRAVQTSNEISNEIGMEPELTDKLKDWNVGIYTGKPVKSSLSDMHNYIDNSNEKIPQGESFKSFYSRCAPFLDELISNDKTNLVVTHNRVLTLLNALLSSKGKALDKSVMKKKGPIEPAGIMVIDPDWNVIQKSNVSQSQV